MISYCVIRAIKANKIEVLWGTSIYLRMSVEFFVDSFTIL